MLPGSKECRQILTVAFQEQPVFPFYLSEGSPSRLSKWGEDSVATFALVSFVLSRGP